MRSYEQAIEYVLAQSKDLIKRRRERQEYVNSNLSPADKAEKIDRIDDDIRLLERRRLGALQDLVAYPPDYQGYFPQLAQFWQQTPVERSVFIMTKYPDGADAALDTQLQAVIDAVVAAVKACNFHPHLAVQQKLHANLWENVECHMLACGRGIAIVEDRFNARLNPNVAMEWGFMRAFRKPVTYLVEKGVKAVPADVAGLIQSRFDWANPAGDILAIVKQELPP